MADILIRGIRLPQEDDPKVFLLKFHEDNTAEMVAVGYPQKRYDVIPVPPHGRLIDADALLLEKPDLIHRGLCFGGGYRLPEEIIESATVIEASEVE